MRYAETGVPIGTGFVYSHCGQHGSQLVQQQKPHFLAIRQDDLLIFSPIYPPQAWFSGVGFYEVAGGVGISAVDLRVYNVEGALRV